MKNQTVVGLFFIFFSRKIHAQLSWARKTVLYLRVQETFQNRKKTAARAEGRQILQELSCTKKEAVNENCRVASLKNAPIYLRGNLIYFNADKTGNSSITNSFLKCLWRSNMDITINADIIASA